MPKSFADKALEKKSRFNIVGVAALIVLAEVLVLVAGIVYFVHSRKPIIPDIVTWSTGGVTIQDPMPPAHLTINGSRWMLEKYDYQDDPDAQVRDRKGNVIGHIGAMTSCIEHRIWYDPFKTAALLRDNLWHEVTHAELCNEDDKTVKMVSGVNNLTHDHCIVYWLGMSNSVFVHDNPEFMKWAENW